MTYLINSITLNLHEKSKHKTLLIEKNKYGYSAVPKGTLFYSVKKGDYLFKIAQEFGISVKNLCSLNGINRNSILRVGQKLRIKT